ncbi:outer membrane lipoprotein-sorting protein [Treponema denticola]|uniref:outer membrane lipoprotein-sorting protein n=1 Tax=Treponema denticola TaxID=158 RepID=UPI0020A35A2A|nr:outer membrane lipoprotein-sorting protein [Treponema denticola]UTD07323.1 outer membrane lipoprotein-sorting protein [Treponema denticola]UTY23662.1 outer membrane lipoprotein-sorting protein [Treponema denticola]
MKYFINKKLLIILIAFFVSIAVFAEIPSMEEMYKIMDKVFDTGNFKKDFTSTLTLIVEKPNQPKEVIQFKLFRRDTKDQTSLIQLAPEADKGNGYLQEKENLWFYDPIAHQFTHSSLKRNLANSDTKLSDVNKKSQFRQAWEILKIEEAKLGKYEVYAVTAKALEKDAAYAQEKFFVRKDEHLLLKIESYGASGKHMRTTLIPKYANVEGMPLPVHQIYINELIKGEKTTQIFQDFSTAKIDDVVFTKAYLEKIN